MEEEPKPIEPTAEPKSSVKSLIKDVEATELTGDFKVLYEQVAEKVELTIASKKFTAQGVAPLINTIIRIVQKWNESKPEDERITGSEKGRIAQTLLEHFVFDMRKRKHIDEDTYELILLGMNFAGPALFDLGKKAYRAIHKAVSDVAASGCCNTQ